MAHSAPSTNGLPRGTWTNLETNQVTTGPRTLDVESKSLPVWARNGAIVPLDSKNGMGLHYFPSLGGEFFLLEGDIAEYSQVHAAPALDFMRLEIESKKDRDYQWVVHHVEKPAGVEFEDKPHLIARLPDHELWMTFFRDSEGNLLSLMSEVRAQA